MKMRNPFIILKGVEEEKVDVAGADKERKEGAKTTSLPKGRVLVPGDSQVIDFS